VTQSVYEAGTQVQATYPNDNGDPDNALYPGDVVRVTVTGTVRYDATHWADANGVGSADASGLRPYSSTATFKQQPRRLGRVQLTLQFRPRKRAHGSSWVDVSDAGGFERRDVFRVGIGCGIGERLECGGIGGCDGLIGPGKPQPHARARLGQVRNPGRLAYGLADDRTVAIPAGCRGLDPGPGSQRRRSR